MQSDVFERNLFNPQLLCWWAVVGGKVSGQTELYSAAKHICLFPISDWISDNLEVMIDMLLIGVTLTRSVFCPLLQPRLAHLYFFLLPFRSERLFVNVTIGNDRAISPSWQVIVVVLRTSVHACMQVTARRAFMEYFIAAYNRLLFHAAGWKGCQMQTSRENWKTKMWMLHYAKLQEKVKLKIFKKNLLLIRQSCPAKKT